MIIGILKERKDEEYRVSITPDNAKTLINLGHEILIEKEAGIGSGFSNEEYEMIGATIKEDANEICNKSEMILKVKEPIESEYELFRNGQIVFTYFHFASSKSLLDSMIKRKIIAIAYETVQDENGCLPLLEPMSEIAGKLSTQIAAYLLTKPFGGKGLLIGGSSGVLSANVLIIGAGVAGVNAAKIASGMGAIVNLLDININKIRYLSNFLAKNINLIQSNSTIISKLSREADVVIGAVLIPGEKAPKIMSEDDIKNMKKGSVVVDISIDQGGCFETSKPTCHSNPVYINHDIIHYCVTNIPAMVPQTSTIALSNATINYVIDIANKGVEKAIEENIALKRGLSLLNGEIIDEKLLKIIN
jgi:alanine dehydrogenase